MWRKTLFVMSVVILACGAGLGFVYDTLENEFKPDTSKTKVVGLPSSYQVNPVLPAYSGQHPRLAERPEETFPFPIKLGESGPVEPLFAGPVQYPFLCMSEESGLGQPLVDNTEGAGIPIYAETEEGFKNKSKIVGYSKDCSLPTQILYYYQTEEDGKYIKLQQSKMALETLPDAVRWLRVEVGTINRFIYALILPVSAEDMPTQPATSPWNKKLIYHFKGGISIGFKQGMLRLHHISRDLKEQLKEGYAVAYSTGNETSNHYNMWLAEDTAARVKKQFVANYGKPKYTVGIGASGGALQQYLIAQNHPGLLDAAITLYSYPDMVTQVAYSLDCELMEYYFDNTAKHNLDWRNWDKREAIEGVNNIQGFDNKFNYYQAIIDLANLRIPSLSDGASECSNGWRASHALINNPNFNDQYFRFDEAIQKNVQWSHWNNLANFYGTDQQGWANTLFDNQGVQYGLSALKEKEITAETFIHLNSHIGGWKPQKDMQQEYYWHISGHGKLKDMLISSQHNMTHEGRARPVAKRSYAPEESIKAAYLSGHLFTGLMDIPVIDLRHYLEEHLDIHHSFASFTSRLRIQDMMGDSKHHVIWSALRPHKPFKEAFDAMDHWLSNIRHHPHRSLAENRPDSLSDRCYGKGQSLIYNGDDAWNGLWNGEQNGPCLQQYPMYSSSRMVAGENLRSEVLKCALQPVKTAMDKGLYAPIDMTPYQDQLETIFPNGVCDYDAAPLGKPGHLMSKLKAQVHLKTKADTHLSLGTSD